VSISDKFNRFYDKIKMSHDDITLVSSRYERISYLLSTEYYGRPTKDYSLYVGSYGRDTEVSISDIDMLFRLPFKKYEQYNNYASNGQSALLQEVKNVISKTYSRTILKGDGQIISVTFSDGITFEILPAFINEGHKSFTYADSNFGGSWKVTSPKEEQRAIQEINNDTNKNLKKLCRMMRIWKNENNVKIPGILIDILAYKFMKDYEYRDKSFYYYDWLTRDFLKYMSEIPKEQNKWQVMGSNRFITHTDDFRYKAKVSYNVSVVAIEKEKINTEAANQEWRKIYGRKFEG